MSDFRINGPALVSFSGGRTSGYMLRRILDAHGGQLPDDVHAVFANTAKEREETLDFVRDCAEAWNVQVHWVERTDGGGWREVNHASASREGEPFARLLEERKFLPNPVARFCTTELKIRPMKGWMLARGYEHWTNVVGIRADEPRRVAKRAGKVSKERWDESLPLARAGVTVEDVRAFWSQQPFDLRLRPWEGNCDLCYLKGIYKRQRVMRDRPDLAAWWIEQERKVGGEFRGDAPSYAKLFRIVDQQPLLLDSDPACDLTDLGDCECDLEAA